LESGAKALGRRQLEATKRVVEVRSIVLGVCARQREGSLPSPADAVGHLLLRDRERRSGNHLAGLLERSHAAIIARCAA
jgi:hypothetical protein